MAFSPISQGQLAQLLQLSYNQTVVFQGSQDIRDAEFLLQRKVGVPEGEAQEFMIQGSLGSAAVQWSKPGLAGNYPEAQTAQIARKKAEFKEINATISLQKSVWDAAMRSPTSRYLEPLVLETQSKAIAHKRRLAQALHGDGTGVIGQVLSASVVSGQMVVALSTANSARGFVGWFEFEDILVLKAANSAASALDSNLAVEPAFWMVKSKDRAAASVSLQPLDANKQPIVGLVSLSTAPAAGEVFYLCGQATIPDLTSPIIDYAQASEQMAGLESLCAADGRVVHGILMDGATAGTRLNALGAIVDSTQIQSVMSQVKLRVGHGRYVYDKFMCADEVYDSIINSGETDRRFMVEQDQKRGSSKFVYKHQSDSLELVTSEFCPKNRIRIIPSVQHKKGVLELRMTDFDKVEVDGQSSYLGVNAGGYQKTVNQFMTGYGTLINMHPAACATIDNFIIS